jgi:peptide/nickel transport system permease protein
VAVGRYLLFRVVQVLPVVIGITLMTFVISHVIAGDPARLIVGEMASQEALEQVRREYGLDQPLPVQYGRYMARLATGDLGSSYMTKRPVIESLRDFLPATIELALAALLIAVLLGGTLGIVSAVARGSPIDHVVRVVAVSGVSLPAFWLGLVLLVVFYLWLGWLPGGGRISSFVPPPQRVTGMYLVDSLIAGDGEAFRSALGHLVLPALVLGFGHMASIARVLRASMLDVLLQDYVRTARAKGVRERVVIARHALRNALLPTITIIGLQIGGLLEGAVLTETVFAWPGMGKFAVDAIRYLDYPVVLGFTIVAAVMYVAINLLVDVLYSVLDPRIQLAA